MYSDSVMSWKSAVVKIFRGRGAFLYVDDEAHGLLTRTGSLLQIDHIEGVGVLVRGRTPVVEQDWPGSSAEVSPILSNVKYFASGYAAEQGWQLDSDFRVVKGRRT
jgi:hypothetical protein